MQCVTYLKEEVSEDVMNDTSYVKVAEFLSEYVQHLRNFYVMGVKHRYIVEVLCNVIRASREVD